MLRCTCLSAGVLSLLVSVAVAAEPITVDYSFEQPTIVPITILGENYDRIVLPGCPSGGRVGQPALPARGATILLPYGTDLESVAVTAGERVLLGSGLRVEPVAQPAPLSVDQMPPPQPDPAIYQSDQAFPGVRYYQISTQLFRGFQMVILRLQPVEYVPASGELYYFPHLTVTVQTADTGRVSELYRGFPEDAARARRKVDNPAAVQTYPAAERGERSFSLLILTTPDLTSAFAPLAAYHNSHGMPTVIRNTDEVGSNPDDIRAYLQTHHVSEGIDFLLVGRDDDAIPAKNLYVDYVSDMPGDLYYGCLDGTWNYDGDSYWGEPTDGDNGGDVDLVAEVYVGRACVDNAADATRFVNKTIWYLSDQHAHMEKILLVGEYLGFGGESEYATNAMNELIDGSSAYGYTTVGFPSDLLDIDTLYDAPGYDWPKSELITRINNSVYVVNHLGHGDVDYAMKLYNTDLPQLVNSDLCFFYSQTCLAGHFDGYDCWAETNQTKMEHAGFAVVMNAREGYGAFNSTDGPSQRYNREFWDAVYNPNEAISELGAVNADSKEDNLWRINEDIMRWCYYEINLFGDPTIPLPGACIDAGELEVSAATLGCEGSLDVELRDCGLNVNDGGIDFATVQVTSDSDPVGIEVTLVETNLKSARFVGTIDASTTSTPGKVLVSPGDTVTVTYLDADNGQGQQVTVTATALVDCTPPNISYVHVPEETLLARSATIAFVCDEPAVGTIHYGLACDALVWTATGTGLAVNPSVTLAPLSEDTTYYYTVDATDEAGNTGSDLTCRSFTTPDVPEFYTEYFDTSPNDLDNRSLSFVPNGSSDFYWACNQPITQLPTDPAGGASLALTNNNNILVTLSGGALVYLYGVSYNKFYVGSNGYITFGSGDNTSVPSLTAHFNKPRIAGLFADLYPTSGQVTWKQLDDRAVVTFLNVSEYGAGNQNTFQIEMFFDGKITVSYLNIAATGGLAGLSASGGVPSDFYESDLTTLGVCQTFPPTAEDAAVSTPESTAADFVLPAQDDGLPNPPCALTYTVLTLPTHGTLIDPAYGPITDVPYTLLNHGDIVHYTPRTHYFGPDELTFKANDGGTPPDGGDSNVGHLAISVIGVPEIVWNFALDANPGWSTTGAWAFGQPLGAGSHNRDPSGGHTGSNVYGYNLAGDYANNLSPQYLTTPVLDCATLTQVELHFWRWLAVEGTDHAGVEVSSDGVTWTPVWSNVTTISEGAWTQRVYSLAATADHQPTVYIRWVMGPTDHSVTYPGWNIDDIEVWALVPAPDLIGDMNCDLVVGFGDINPFVLALTDPAAYQAAHPQCNIMHGDINGDGSVNFGDINPFVALLTR